MKSIRAWRPGRIGKDDMNLRVRSEVRTRQRRPALSSVEIRESDASNGALYFDNYHAL